MVLPTEAVYWSPSTENVRIGRRR